MPVAIVYYDGTKAAKAPLQLEGSLPSIIAKRLNVGASSIYISDVTVIFEAFGPHDVHKHDVVVTLTAHPFPERVKLHHEITVAIAEDVAAVIKDCSIGVIVNLSPLEWTSVEWVDGIRKTQSA